MWRDHLKAIEEIFLAGASDRPFSPEEMRGITAFAPDLARRLEKYSSLSISEAIQKTRLELEAPQPASD